MSHSDPIADMLTRIRNAASATHESVEVPASKVKVEIAKVLKQEGYIQSFEVVQDGPGKTIKIQLKYGPMGEKVISGVKRVSKPGLRVYKGASSLPRVFGGLGISIISTSAGMKTDRQAKKEKVGGEVICQVW